jgi:DNA-binding NarL/FixJ family response regulator
VIRVLIADDEEPSRARLRHLLGTAEDVEIVAEAADVCRRVAAGSSLRAEDHRFTSRRSPFVVY